MSNLLEVKNVIVNFYTTKETVHVLTGFSLNVVPGDIVGIVGESGSGKSVAISSIINLLGKNGRIDGGEIFYNGKDVLKMNEEELRKLRSKSIGVIPNNAKGMLHPIVSIGQQLMNRYLSAHPKAKKEEARRHAIKALELVQIPDPEKRMKVLPSELSGGMAQRVLIAMALINEPELIIADDATTGLDVTVQAQILDLIEEQVKKLSNSVIMVTHDFGIVAQYCKKIGILSRGHIVEYGDSVEEILMHALHPYTRTLLAATPGVPGEYEKEVRPAKSAKDEIPARGCLLQERCGKCLEKCRIEEPPIFEVSKGHWVKCHFAEKGV